MFKFKTSLKDIALLSSTHAIVEGHKPFLALTGDQTKDYDFFGPGRAYNINIHTLNRQINLLCRTLEGRTKSIRFWSTQPGNYLGLSTQSRLPKAVYSHRQTPVPSWRWLPSGHHGLPGRLSGLAI